MDIFGNRAADAAAELTKLRKAADENVRAYVAGSLGSSADQQRLDAQTAYYRQRDDLAKAKDSYTPDEYAKKLDELFQALTKNYDRINQQEAEAKRFAGEDLDVRDLRAKAKNKEADALDLANRQQAEIVRALTEGMSEEYIAHLKNTQALEKSKAALDELTKSSVNLVSGYKYQNTIFRFANPHGIDPRGDPIDAGIVRPPINPYSGLTSNVIAGDGDLTINFTLDGTVVAKSVLKKFRSQGSRVFGDAARWAEIQQVS